MSFQNDIEKLEDWAQCPYDSNHKMYYRRFAIHLTKCRERNPKKAAEISICIYDRTHHVPNDKIAEHLEVCRRYQEDAATEFRRTIQSQPDEPRPRPLTKLEKRILKKQAEVARKLNEEWIDEEEEGSGQGAPEDQDA